jgi:hypothetical protein
MSPQLTPSQGFSNLDSRFAIGGEWQMTKDNNRQIQNKLSASPWPKKDGLLIRALDLHAVSLDVGIFFERVVHDAAIEGGHGFEFDDIAPATDLFRGVLGFLDEGIAGLGAITAHIDRYLWHARVLLIEQAIEQILQFGQGLSLPSNETARVFGFDVEQQAVVEMMFVNADIEAEMLEKLLEDFFRSGTHKIREA